MLLRREKAPAIDAIERLVGLQAQVPISPYFALWARLEGFRHEELADLIRERKAVRLALMRSTIHLVTARDCLALRPVLQPALEHHFMVGTPFGRNLVGMDIDALVAAGRQLLDRQPLTTRQLGGLLQERWPDRDRDSLAYAIRDHVPLIQLPPRGVWGESQQTIYATAETFLGRAQLADSAPDNMAARYFAAFGPATVADFRAWSGLSLRPDVVERLRPRLRRFRDDRGRELLDLQDAPLPDPGTPTPVRFLPDYDDALLAHADRSRILSESNRKQGAIGTPTLLVDGFVQGTWRIRRSDGRATLDISTFAPLSKPDANEVAEEGERLLAFAAADASTHDVRVVGPAF